MQERCCVPTTACKIEHQKMQGKHEIVLESQRRMSNICLRAEDWPRQLRAFQQMALSARRFHAPMLDDLGGPWLRQANSLHKAWLVQPKDATTSSFQAFLSSHSIFTPMASSPT
jgi:hypothetical protein